MLRYKRINDYFFMDTFFATKKAGRSSRGNTCCQLFVTDKGFVYVVPMKTKGEVLQALKQFAKEIGAPDAIVSDAAAEQSSQKLRKFCSAIGTTLRLLEEGTPWANKAELYVGLIKEAVRKDMKESNCPLAFWDYCVERRARINNLTAKSIFKLHGTNAHTALVTGEEGDISNLSDHKWYDWCYYTESITESFHIRERYWDEYLVLQLEQETKWHSGSSSSRMEMSFHDVPCDPYWLTNYIVQRSRRNENSTMT
jgi:transposase InsO family protein